MYSLFQTQQSDFILLKVQRYFEFDKNPFSYIQGSIEEH